MAKSKQKLKGAPPPKNTASRFSLSTRGQDILFLSLLTLLLIFLLKPMVLDGLSPEGVDAIALKGKTHQILEYKNKTGETALWNPYIFSGMPIYHLLLPEAKCVDTLIYWLCDHIKPADVFIYYFIGLLGMYLLLRFLKMPPLISFVGTISFLLFPHYKSLYLEGHLAKFRALMFLPWVIFMFVHFLEKRTLFAAALFALAFGVQIRTQHYQIVFYTAMLILALGVYPFIKDLLVKDFKKFSRSVLYLVLALILGIGMAAQPLFLADEYLPYSKRGKTTIDLNSVQQPGSAGSDGVSMEYATQWSTHPSELLTWLIPRFYGGMSGEKYEGNAVPQLRNRMVPGYWGYMPFTQSYEYMGVITLLLAAIGLYFKRKDPFILSLAGAAVFFILLSFGEYFSSLYSLFYYHFPYFNKFRVPMMSVSLTAFIMAIFASYGLKSLAERDLKKSLKQHRDILIVCAAFLVLGILLLLVSPGFSFLKTGETYEPQIEQVLVKIRQEFFNQDLIRYFILLILTALGLFGYLTRRLNFLVLGAILALISIVDLVSIQSRYQKQMNKSDVLEKQYFRATETDLFLEKDPEIFRIFPTGRLFGDNRWAYRHQTIGGYDPIKMYTIEEIITNNLTNGIDGTQNINWNILKVLDVKYVISEQKIDHPLLTPVQTDPGTKLYTYLFNQHLGRGFFVGSYKIITAEDERLRYMNSLEFKPETTAILEEEPVGDITHPDSSECRLTYFTPNQSRYKVFTSQQALLVISECWYPPGWKFFIDQQPVQKIYKTNHAMQSIVVPAGAHEIELRFEPDSFYRNIRYAWIALGLMYVIIIVGILDLLRRRLAVKSGSS